MKLTDTQIAEYDRKGFLILPNMFSGRELHVLRSELKRVSASDAPGINREDNGEIRSIYRLHHPASPTYSRYFEKFVTMPRIAEAAKEKMGDPVPIEGRPGTLVVFHPNLLHASGHNLSRHSRWHIFTVFNRISNKQGHVEKPRPEWAVDREFKRVELTDDNLLDLERLEAVES